MQCEICEKEIKQGKRIRLEGSIVVVCEECSRYGEVVAETEPPEPKPVIAERKAGVEKRPEFNLDITEELVDDYAELIKSRRESLGMKQEELAKRINEPSSLIHRIESKRFEPGPDVVKKIQLVLGIKLMERTGSGELGGMKAKSLDELTLGDLAIIKKKQKE